jgi:hypothetical protein
MNARPRPRFRRPAGALVALILGASMLVMPALASAQPAAPVARSAAASPLCTRRAEIPAWLRALLVQVLHVRCGTTTTTTTTSTTTTSTTTTTVPALETTTLLSVRPSVGAPGDLFTFTAVVSDGLGHPVTTGTVRLYPVGVDMAPLDAGGRTTYSLHLSEPQGHPWLYAAIYSGAPGYAGSTGMAGLFIEAPTTTTIATTTTV